MIAFVDTQEADCTSLRRAFYRAYVHSTFSKPRNVETLAPYPLMGFMIPRPHRMPRIDHLCERIHTAFPGLPIGFFLPTDLPNRERYAALADLVFDETVAPRRMAYLLLTFHKERGARNNAAFNEEGVRTDIVHPHCVTILGSSFRVCRLHWMILRYLQLCAPRPVPTEEMLNICFPLRAKKLVRSNVSTQICFINQYTRRFMNDYAVIHFIRRQGYQIAPYHFQENQE